MAADAKPEPFGIYHLTVVPANAEPDGGDGDEEESRVNRRMGSMSKPHGRT